MSVIKVMDHKLANMIAAGEVIERPSSVVKELVENSLDAGSTKIKVMIYGAGRDKIIVSDNGSGMDREDAILAFKRHASSKLYSERDLFNIKTMGFRGEALASIASVSKVTMTTSDGKVVGTKVTIEDENVTVEDASLIKGTTFTIEELFFNTPARLKYLKSDTTENSSILEVMQRLAMARSDVAFSLYFDDRLSFATNGNGKLLEVIANIYGYDAAKKMIPISFSTYEFEVTGYLGLPEIAKSNRYYMITLLNQRSVYMPKIQKAIIDGYSDYIFNSKFPFVVLDIKVDYALVDVNVHPTKKEVRLSNENNLYAALEKAISEKLKNLNHIQEVNIKSTEKVSTMPMFEQIEVPFKENIVRPTTSNQHQATEPKKEKIEENSPIKINFEDFDEQLPEAKELFKEIEVKEEKKVDIEEKNEITPLGQILNTYIVCSAPDGFYLIDQHAANERINYEKYQEILNSNIETCTPLFPIIVNLNPSDAMRLNERHFKLLEDIGLTIELFGTNTLKVSRIPLFLREEKDDSYILELIDQVLGKEKIDLISLRKHVIATMACKASIKANDRLNLFEMKQLIDQLFKCKNPTCCPHGRPTIVRFKKYDIEKMFKRTAI